MAKEIHELSNEQLQAHIDQLRTVKEQVQNDLRIAVREQDRRVVPMATGQVIEAEGVESDEVTQ